MSSAPTNPRIVRPTVVGTPSTYTPTVAFQSFNQSPESKIFRRKVLTNALTAASSLLTPTPYGSVVNGVPTTLRSVAFTAFPRRIASSRMYASARPCSTAATQESLSANNVGVLPGTYFWRAVIAVEFDSVTSFLSLRSLTDLIVVLSARTWMESPEE